MMRIETSLASWRPQFLSLMRIPHMGKGQGTHVRLEAFVQHPVGLPVALLGALYQTDHIRRLTHTHTLY